MKTTIVKNTARTDMFIYGLLLLSASRVDAGMNGPSNFLTACAEQTDVELFFRVSNFFKKKRKTLQRSQVTQLSQRDHATAAWLKFGQKWKMIFCRHYRSVFNHCDVIGL